jgi:hypothetical protein
MVAEQTSAPPALRVAIPCAHPGCRHLAAYVTFRAGQIVVEVVSSHHGEKHRTSVTVDHAGRLVTEEGAQPT